MPVYQVLFGLRQSLKGCVRLNDSGEFAMERCQRHTVDLLCRTLTALVVSEAKGSRRVGDDEGLKTEISSHARCRRYTMGRRQTDNDEGVIATSPQLLLQICPDKGAVDVLLEQRLTRLWFDLILDGDAWTTDVQRRVWRQG
jgi:hypothetical protein